MGQVEHRAYVKLKNAQEKAKRNPYFSDLKDKVKDAEINYLKAKEEDRLNTEAEDNLFRSLNY